ncbi:hypothetical protein B484DRAFT_396351 [Ochromonadaceae sp. CCMP2298]|nr:hypothetical protein B484DRAFT_396351 [Ochromonadaceae sp. CCMP2298]
MLLARALVALCVVLLSIPALPLRWSRQRVALRPRVNGRMGRLWSGPVLEQEAEEISLKVISFNVLAPCYKRIEVDGKKAIESDHEHIYLKRNTEICNQLVASKADIICLQEFWSSSEQLQQLYRSMLCEGDCCYSMQVLPRTSHWNQRGDSVAVFVRTPRLQIEDVRYILFHDVGDRVALMLLLALHPDQDQEGEQSQEKQGGQEGVQGEQGQALSVARRKAPVQRFICVNTHLLFPHNPYSSKIRLREITKILGFVEGYRQKELCTSVCNRSDVRLPVILTGDFNGSPRGSVYRYVRSQNFRSALEDFYLGKGGAEGEGVEADKERVAALASPGGADSSGDISDSTASSISSDSVDGGLSRASKWGSWISHRSHLNKNVGVDHIFFHNPSEQVAERLPPLPDWTNLVFREVLHRIVHLDGAATAQSAFSAFDADGSSKVSREEFAQTIRDLGFVGEGTASLTNEEIDMLVASADKDNDGQIDYREFYDRLWLASALQESESAGQEMEGPVMEGVQGVGARGGWGGGQFSAAFWADDDIDADVDVDACQLEGYDIGDDDGWERAGGGGEKERERYRERGDWGIERGDRESERGDRGDRGERGDRLGAADEALQDRQLAFARSDWLSVNSSAWIGNKPGYRVQGPISLSVEGVGGGGVAGVGVKIRVPAEVGAKAEAGTEAGEGVVAGVVAKADADFGAKTLGEEAEAEGPMVDRQVCFIEEEEEEVISVILLKPLRGGMRSRAPTPSPLASRTDAVPMGDLRVRAARVVPGAMERGVWPSDYALSDHGIIETVFTATINYG